MVNYATFDDCIDPSVTVTQENLDAADSWVDGELYRRGITPSDVVLPSARLTALAATWAKSLAAADGDMGDGPLAKKAASLQKTALLLAGQLTRESLGLALPTSSGAGYGSITLGRG